MRGIFSSVSVLRHMFANRHKRSNCVYKVLFVVYLIFVMLICIYILGSCVLLYSYYFGRAFRELPRIQQALDLACGEGIGVDISGLQIDESETIWIGQRPDGVPVRCRLDSYHDQWTCSC